MEHRLTHVLGGPLSGGSGPPCLDAAWEKFGFYAAHDVDEVVIADPRDRSVHWFALAGSGYEAVGHSRLLDVDVAEIARQIDWPPAVDETA